MKTYCYNQFYLDVLREFYDSVTNLKKIELEIKLQLKTYRRCVWENCKKITRTLCNNQGCSKYACNDHSLIICSSCFFDSVLQRPDFDRINFSDKHENDCSEKKCKKRSRIGCASCKKKLCVFHRYFLCSDCANLHSDKNSTFSHKFKPKRINLQ